MQQIIDIYTDGGCRHNPGIGAYAAIFKDHATGRDLYRLGDFNNHTTNNEMEASAVLLAMEVIVALAREGRTFASYHIYSDSNISVETFNSWLEGWILNGNINAKANNKIWKQVYQYKKEAEKYGIAITMEYVKAHADNQGNNEVDGLCNKLMDDGKVYEIVLTNPNIRELAQKDLRNFSYTEDDATSDISHIEKLPKFVVVDFDRRETYEIGEDDELYAALKDYADKKNAFLSEGTRIIKEVENGED
jgi:ribonuclease HI